MTITRILSAMKCMLLAVLVLPGTDACAGVIYDLAADWSDSANPNGVWAYNRDTGDLHPTNVPEYWSNLGLTEHQNAWAEANLGFEGHISAFLKANGSPSGIGDNDFVASRVLVHPNDPANSFPTYANAVANITWTSPMDGEIDIDGGLWIVSNSLGRDTDWNIKLNGVLLTGGTIAWSEAFDSSNTKPLSSGSGGATALNDIGVSAGDEIRVELIRNTSNSVATFTGIDFTVDAVVPEPSTLALALIASLGFMSIRRTQ